MRQSVFVLFLFFATPAAAEDYAAIVSEAFASFDSSYREHWAFTETTTGEEVALVGRYDPRLPDGERWTLLSVDGREPTPEEQADYQDDKDNDQQNRQEDQSDDDNNAVADIVNVNSLQLLDETEQHWLFSFAPNGDNEDEEAGDFMAHVTGRLEVAKNGPYVETIELSNEKPIKPAFSVKISRFFTRFTFGPATDGGPIVPRTMDMQVKGRAALLVRFDEAESIHYSDYEFAGS